MFLGRQNYTEKAKQNMFFACQKWEFSKQDEKIQIFLPLSRLQPIKNLALKTDFNKIHIRDLWRKFKILYFSVLWQMNMNIYVGVNVSEIICSYGKHVIIAEKILQQNISFACQSRRKVWKSRGGGGGVIWWT